MGEGQAPWAGGEKERHRKMVRHGETATEGTCMLAAVLAGNPSQPWGSRGMTTLIDHLLRIHSHPYPSISSPLLSSLLLPSSFLTGCTGRFGFHTRVTVPPGARVVALGDLHGDAQSFEHLLRIGRVVDPESGRWTSGNDILVRCESRSVFEGLRE